MDNDHENFNQNLVRKLPISSYLDIGLSSKKTKYTGGERESEREISSREH